jgi:hypothetical protein
MHTLLPTSKIVLDVSRSLIFYCSNSNLGNSGFVLDNFGGDGRGLLEFDLSAIPASATIATATLTLWQVSNTQTTSIGIHPNLGPWVESTLTFDTRPNRGTLLDSHVPGSPGAFETWDLTNSVRDMVAGVVVNYGWQLIDSDFAPTVQYASSSASDPNQRPKLCVVYCMNVLPCFSC